MGNINSLPPANKGDYQPELPIFSNSIQPETSEEVIPPTVTSISNAQKTEPIKERKMINLSAARDLASVKEELSKNVANGDEVTQEGVVKNVLEKISEEFQKLNGYPINPARLQQLEVMYNRVYIEDLPLLSEFETRLEKMEEDSINKSRDALQRDDRHRKGWAESWREEQEEKDNT